MNAKQLYEKNPDGTYTGTAAYFCGACRRTAASEQLADHCCAPVNCRDCGTEVPPGQASCDGCWSAARMRQTAERHKAATKIRVSEYRERVVYAESSDEWINIDDLDRWLDEWRIEHSSPPFIFGAKFERYMVHADDILDMALDNAFEGAGDFVKPSAIEQLEAFIAKWCATNLPTGYAVDHSVAIDIP